MTRPCLTVRIAVKCFVNYVHGPVILIRVPYSHNLYLNTDLNSKIVITSAVLSFRERALEKAEGAKLTWRDRRL